MDKTYKIEVAIANATQQLALTKVSGKHALKLSMPFDEATSNACKVLTKMYNIVVIGWGSFLSEHGPLEFATKKEAEQEIDKFQKQFPGLECSVFEVKED